MGVNTIITLQAVPGYVSCIRQRLQYLSITVYHVKGNSGAPPLRKYLSLRPGGGWDCLLGRINRRDRSYRAGGSRAARDRWAVAWCVRGGRHSGSADLDFDGDCAPPEAVLRATCGWRTG